MLGYLTITGGGAVIVAEVVAIFLSGRTFFPSFFAFCAFAVKKLVFIEASIDLYALALPAIALYIA
jgi:hypothetical protein